MSQIGKPRCAGLWSVPSSYGRRITVRCRKRALPDRDFCIACYVKRLP